MGPPGQSNWRFTFYWQKLQDKNSRAIKARRLGPAQTTYFLLSQSGDGSDHTCAERLLGGQRGVMSKDVLPRCLFSKIHLG